MNDKFRRRSREVAQLTFDAPGEQRPKRRLFARGRGILPFAVVAALVGSLGFKNRRLRDWSATAVPAVRPSTPHPRTLTTFDSSQPSEPSGPGGGSLAVIFLTVFIDLLGFGIVLPLLPIYAQEFSSGVTDWQIGLLMASFSAMQFLFAPVWGRLSDQVGRRPVLMVGLASSVVCYTLFGIATVMGSLTLLFISRIGAGIAGATISTAQAYIADTTTLAGRAKGMALVGAAFGLGFTLGPLFGYLAVPSGTGDPGPGPGYAAAGLSAIALALAWFKLPESRRSGAVPGEHRLFDSSAWRVALSSPSVGLLILALFVCVLSFANFESTLSLLLYREKKGRFGFDFQQVCLTYALIGLVLSIAQGFLVRRLTTFVSEPVLAAFGTAFEVAGFVLMARASNSGSVPMLFDALVVVVCGFALLMPALNSLISRRSDPRRQGAVLGVAQSTSALARILGPVMGISLLAREMDGQTYFDSPLPYWTAAGMMLLGMAVLFVATNRGQDYAALPQSPAD